MPPTLNKNKIYTVLVLCIGVVTSVWLFRGQTVSTSILKQNNDNLVVSPARNLPENINDDWKKILVNANSGTSTVIDLTKTNDSTFDETTLTAQMAKDFFSQYLLAKKGGKTLTDADKNQIIGNILSSPQYSKASGPVYVATNLHIIPKTDKVTLKKYEDTVNLILKTRSTEIKDSPVLIMSSTMKSGNANELPKLNLIIAVGKGFISDLLLVEVPSDAVVVHLGLINAISNATTNMEDMKEIYTDPVKGMTGLSHYNKSISDFQNALKNINTYFAQKLGE